MIRMIQSQSAGQAKAYFNGALSKPDYYLNSQEIVGFSFRGKIASRIGIVEHPTKDMFYILCENINPITGENLTPRKIQNRTAGYDINFHCPKSVSILNVLSKDNHILDAFQESVNETMQDIEKDAKARVRKNDQDDNRETGELLWADFIHQTARPVKGALPDPHLHAHCFTFNVTWDKIEKQFKAGQFRDIKRDMPYYQAMFHKRLSDKLAALGYGIHRTSKSFEVDGVPQNVIDLFSKRTDEIGRVAKENNITDAKELDKLGSRTRAKKQKGLTMAQLKNDWRKQIKSLGMNGNKANGTIIRNARGRVASKVSPEQCINHAVQHLFERSSVIQDRRILETAYRYGVATSLVTVDQINDRFRRDKKIIKVKDGSKILCTTQEVIAQEKQMIALAQKGKDKFKPLYKTIPAMSLSDEQSKAVGHILTTSNQVSVIQGRAGTGKTTLMKEAVRLIENTGKKVIVVAPTSQASRGVLKDEGFENAETVAKLLTDINLQNSLTDQVLWVDEAGLLGVKDMVGLLTLAAQKKARVILSGDTRQHSSVARGDALRLLNSLAGVGFVEVGTIYRQKNKRYREAVQALSLSKIVNAFDILNELNSIKTIDPLKPNKALVSDYLAAIKKGKSVLVISPTHKQGETVTTAIRKQLRSVGRIEQKEVYHTKLVNLNMTEAEKADIRSYQKGYVLQFNQNMKGINRGSAWTVESIKENNLKISNSQNESIDFAVERKNNFDVFQQNEIALSKGDSIRITRNGFDNSKKRLNNGQELEVVSIDKKDKIIVRNKISKTEYTLSKDFGHIAHAYCMTSYASQGKTVDEVFIFQPAATFPASDMKQFYVSVSRGRNNVSIYTDDKQALFDHAAKMRDRQSALELINKKNSRQMFQIKRTECHKTNVLIPAKPINTQSRRTFSQPLASYTPK